MTAPSSPKPAAAQVRKRKSWSKALDVASWVMLAGFLAYLLLRDTGGPKQGSAAPALWLQALDGSSDQLLPAQPQPRPLLIKVFASWCGACRRSTWLDDVAGLHSGPHLDYVAVSVDDEIEAARRARAQWSIDSPVLFDRDQALSAKYGIQVLPTYILVDSTGHIARVTTGLPGPLDYKAWHDAH
ncbi:MAG TPA: TlpA disulfide reductase family protein [Polyangiaceae bacterium]|nr:TlpA disulfide reductase family protein [Polyangiaceae bacterium]